MRCDRDEFLCSPLTTTNLTPALVTIRPSRGAPGLAPPRGVLHGVSRRGDGPRRVRVFGPRQVLHLRALRHGRGVAPAAGRPRVTPLGGAGDDPALARAPRRARAPPARQGADPAPDADRDAAQGALLQPLHQRPEGRPGRRGRDRRVGRARLLGAARGRLARRAVALDAARVGVGVRSRRAPPVARHIRRRERRHRARRPGPEPGVRAQGDDARRRSRRRRRARARRRGIRGGERGRRRAARRGKGVEARARR